MKNPDYVEVCVFDEEEGGSLQVHCGSVFSSRHPSARAKALIHQEKAAAVQFCLFACLRQSLYVVLVVLELSL